MGCSANRISSSYMMAPYNEDPDTVMEDAPPLTWQLKGGLITGWAEGCDVEMLDVDAGNVSDRDWPYYRDRPHRARDIYPMHQNGCQIF